MMDNPDKSQTAQDPAVKNQALDNLEGLRRNPYPGRGIVLGCSEDGENLLQLYWIMGRSPNSRNRVFEIDGDLLRTAPYDPAKVEDPSLVIYTAMAQHGSTHVVTNGDHTNTVIEALASGNEGATSLRSRSHEPDAPNNTPRIAGALTLPDGTAWLAIVKADPTDSVLAGKEKAPPAQRSMRQIFEFEQLSPGLGWCLTTYDGDGAPLPSFSGEPRVLPLVGTGEGLLSDYWGCLDRDNRVALALKSINRKTGEASIVIINAHEKN